MNSQITAEDLLLDLKALLKEYYMGTFTSDGAALKISLENGQTFLLKAYEERS